MTLRMKPSTVILSLLASMVLSIGCKKDEAPPEAPPPTPAVGYDSVVFSLERAYFATDGSMWQPVDSFAAKMVSRKIDLTFIFDADSVNEPGFLAPVIRAQRWAWSHHFKPWLADAVAMSFYTTNLTAADFQAARGDEELIAKYFESPTVRVSMHAVYPRASCIGGRPSENPPPARVAPGKVFAFKHSATQKRGLLYVRTDQDSAWTDTLGMVNARVNIIREN